MLTPDICNFFEQRAGIPFDFDEDLAEIGGDYAFAYPTDWSNSLYIILDRMMEALTIIDASQNSIPDDLPPKDDLKKIVTECAIEGVLKNIDNVKRVLNIDSKRIRDFNTLQSHINGLCKLINLLLENDLNDILSNNKFEKLDKSLGNVLTDQFEVHRQDLSQIHFNVKDIHDNFIDMNEE